MNSNSLKRPSFSRHIFVCTGSQCGPDRSPELYQYLKNALKEKGLDTGAARVHRSQTHCLGICQGGPIAVVYPDNIWYQDLNIEKMERVIEEHLIHGRPVREYQLFEEPLG